MTLGTLFFIIAGALAGLGFGGMVSDLILKHWHRN